jgi:hypothetical protein
MADMTGVVQEVQTRDVSGGKKAYNIVVGGQSYGVGLYAPKCKVGDYVKFEIDESRGYKNVARNSLKVSANKAPAEAMAEAEATAPRKTSTGGSVDTRQDTISRQAAMNTAIQFMTLLQSAGVLPAATAKGKGQESLELMLKQYSKDFYEMNTGVVYKDITPGTKNDDVPVETAEQSAPSDEKWD